MWIADTAPCPYILDVMYDSVRYPEYCCCWEYCGTLVLWCPKLMLRVLGVSAVLKAQTLRVLGIRWAVYRTPSTQAAPPVQTSGILHLQYPEHPEYVVPGNTASTRRILPKYILPRTASILQVLQLPPANVICSISNSVNECFHRCSQYLGVWKIIPRENTSETASTRSTYFEIAHCR